MVLLLLLVPMAAVIVLLILRLRLRPKKQPVRIETKMEEPKLPAPAYKAQEITIVEDGLTYIIRDGFWFRQFVFDDMTLELCVKYEEAKKPEPQAEEFTYIHEKPATVEEWYIHEPQPTIYDVPDYRRAMLETACNVGQSHRDLELAMSQCCCTTRSIDEMQARLEIMNLQCKIDDLERMKSIQYVPVLPFTGYGYNQGCGYGSYPNAYRW